MGSRTTGARGSGSNATATQAAAPHLFPAKKRKSGRKNRPLFENGAGEETRTLDVHLGKVVLYQLSYARKTGCQK